MTTFLPLKNHRQLKQHLLHAVCFQSQIKASCIDLINYTTTVQNVYLIIKLKGIFLIEMIRE